MFLKKLIKFILKSLMVLMLLFSIIFSLTSYENYVYNPLSIEDLHKVFAGDVSSIKKIGYEDLNGLTLQGEYIDIFLYRFDKIKLTNNLSAEGDFEGYRIDYDKCCSGWRKQIELINNDNSAFAFPYSMYTNNSKLVKLLSDQMYNPNNYFKVINLENGGYRLFIVCPKERLLILYRISI